jgi:sugar phosphate isomerase/epimerase
MIPGIFARTYASKDPHTLFAQVRRDGFKAVQFNLSCMGLAALPAELPLGLGRGAATAARDNGLALCALSGTYNMVHPDAERRKADRAAFANVLIAAREMSVPLVTLCTGSRDEGDMWRAHLDNASRQAWTDLRAELDHALSLAAEANLRLAVEPEPANVIADARLARRLLDEIGTSRLGIILDAANLLPPEAQSRQREIVAEAMDLLGDDICLVHAKDVDAQGKVVPVGQGVVDMPNFVRRVRSAGYDGPLVSHGFEEPDAPAVGAYLQTLIEDTTR